MPKLMIVTGLPEKKEHIKIPQCASFGGYSCSCGATDHNAVIDELQTKELVVDVEALHEWIAKRRRLKDTDNNWLLSVDLAQKIESGEVFK